jgi:NTP pyrophosphatase (non-canonical NTP hydrolase)
MLQEESGELIAAVNQFLRGRVDEARLVEEVADVMVMCQQAALMLGLDLVDQKVQEKLDRLRKRLEEAR